MEYQANVPMPAAGMIEASFAPLPRHGRVAVVDIGSNSIRLVVFDRPSRSPLPLFNEKVLCGLGRGLDATGRLNEAGVESALVNLARFVRLARAMGATRLDLVATAAVRDAVNGRDFVAEVERRCNVTVRILSGEDEARLSAQGVLSGIPEADGLMGDLGGGSVELVALTKGTAGRHVTLPLGPIRLVDSAEGDREQARALIDRHLATVDWLPDLRGRAFYPVGGAWRTLARIHMEQNNYPLHVIQQYHRPAPGRGSDAGDRAPGQAFAQYHREHAAAAHRHATLRRHAARAAAAPDQARPRRLLGLRLREGHVYSQLPAAEQRRDPLIEACRELAATEERFGPMGELLQAWLDPSVPARRHRRARGSGWRSAISAISPGASTRTTAPSTPSTASFTSRWPASITRAASRRRSRWPCATAPGSICTRSTRCAACSTRRGSAAR